MKKLFVIIAIVLVQLSSHAQERIFDGTYKGSSDGVSYTLYLKNNNGIIKGTVRNSERATIESIIEATISNDNYIKGFQKEKHKKIRFIAIEENRQIIWEIRNGFLSRLFSKSNKVIKYAWVGSNPKDLSDPDQSQPKTTNETENH